MNKELEAFNELKIFIYDILLDTCNSKAFHFTSSSMYLEPFIDKTEKNIKALEIIKEKRLDVGEFICMVNDGGEKLLEEYNNFVFMKPLTIEEYNLLKEVLL